MIIPVLLFLTVGWAQNTKFKEFDVVIYPDYYFPGVMVEINGKVDSTALPITVNITVPANTDSAFFISGLDNDENTVIPLVVQKIDDRHYIRLNLSKAVFRTFVFYNMDVQGDNRKGTFAMQVDQDLENLHLIVQQPIVAENWQYSEQESDIFKDQHGVTFHRLHLHEYKANTVRNVSFSYSNPSGKTSMVQLQAMLSGDIAPGQQDASQAKPARHSLPQWQPLLILVVLAVIIGILFSRQRRKEQPVASSKGKFCTSCGHSLEKTAVYCSNCGAKQ